MWCGFTAFRIFADMNARKLFGRFKERLGRLSFRTGVAVAAACVLCYVISFAQMALPTPVWLKTALWVVFYGLAKTTQYMAILILGKEGVRRIRNYFARRRSC